MDKWRILLVLLCVTLLVAGPANAVQFRLGHGGFFIGITDATSMSRPAPMIGVVDGPITVSYARLWSDQLNSSGDRLSIGWTQPGSNPAPYADLTIDHYRRSDQGGATASLGLEAKPEEFLAVRVGLVDGWLTGTVVPAVSERVEAGL